MAFEPGVVKLKQGGGSNGHNGVKSVVAGLGNRDEFIRLRIGVGHPGSKAQVIPYLTKQTLGSGVMNKSQQLVIFLTP